MKKLILSVIFVSILLLSGCGLSPEENYNKARELYLSKNYEEAMIYYHEAADEGYAKAQYYLGICYYRGRGVKKNPEKAVKWYRKAAMQGNRDAQYALGNCYYYGRGVDQDLESAKTWYRKAADKGHKEAQYNLYNLF